MSVGVPLSTRPNPSILYDCEDQLPPAHHVFEHALVWDADPMKGRGNSGWIIRIMLQKARVGCGLKWSRLRAPSSYSTMSNT
jgi:hypothetical protein